jgi:hypothetical protein
VTPVARQRRADIPVRYFPGCGGLENPPSFGIPVRYFPGCGALENPPSFGIPVRYFPGCGALENPPSFGIPVRYSPAAAGWKTRPPLAFLSAISPAAARWKTRPPLAFLSAISPAAAGWMGAGVLPTFFRKPTHRWRVKCRRAPSLAPRIRLDGQRHRTCRAQEPAEAAIVRLAQGTDRGLSGDPRLIRPMQEATTRRVLSVFPVD